jgi:S1-C subfamily serine protease
LTIVRRRLRSLAAGAIWALAALSGLAACTNRDAATDAPRKDRYVALYEQLHPSVVFLKMQKPSDDPKRKGEWDDAFGSGVVVESGAWGTRVLTASHVVTGARDIVATVGDGPHAPAHVVAKTGADPDTDPDVALLEIPLKNQPPVHLASSSNVEPGTPIGLLGYPIPDVFEDMSVQRTVSLYAGRVASVRKGTLEISITLVGGESGGPVFDASTGEVIGLANSSFDEERSIGFATPIEVAKAFLAQHPRR